MSPSASSSSSLSSHHNDNCHHHHNHHNHHPHVIDIDNPNLDSRPAVPAVEPSHTQQPRQSPTDIRLFNSTSFNDSTPENSYNRTYPSSNSDRNHSLSSPLLCKQDPSQSTLPPNAPTTPRNRESVVKFFSDTDSYRSFAASFFPEDSDGRSLKATVSVTGSFCAFIVFCIGVAISVITLIRVRAADFAEHDLNCAQLARVSQPTEKRVHNGCWCLHCRPGVKRSKKPARNVFELEVRGGLGGRRGGGSQFGPEGSSE